MKAEASKVGKCESSESSESSAEIASSECESANGEALPEGWAWSPVKDVVDHLRNGYVGPTRGIYHDEGIPYILSKHVRDNVLTFDDETFITQEFNEKNKKSILKAGDVLLVQTGHVGHSAVVPPKHEGHNCHALIVITPTQDCLDGHFLSYQFAGPEIQSAFGLIEKGMTLRHLNCRDVIKVPIRIAPKAEQSRIVSAIESLQERSSRARDLLAEVGPLIGQLRQSVLRAAFSGRLTADWRAANPNVQPASELLENIRTERRQRWETQQLAKYEAKGKEPPKNWQDKYKEPEPVDESELPKLSEGWCWVTVYDLPKDEPNALNIGPFGSNLKVKDYRDEGVPLVFVREIRAEVFGDRKTKFVTFKKANELSSHQVQGGDLLITKMGDPPGDTAIYPKSHPNAVITADCIKLAPDPQLTSSAFLRYWLRTQPMLDRILEETKGVAQRKLSLKRFRAIAMPLPPPEEQNKIVELIRSALEPCRAIEASLASIESSLTQLDQSTLSKAFRGELVPQDPNDEPASELLARIRTTREKLEAEKKAKA